MLKKNGPNTSKKIQEYYAVSFQNDLISKNQSITNQYAFMWFYRPLMTQLGAPKIPEGERVDFDVCALRSSFKKRNTLHENQT